MYKGPREHLSQVLEAQSWEELNLWVTWLQYWVLGDHHTTTGFSKRGKMDKNWQVKTFVMTAVDHEALIDQLL